MNNFFKIHGAVLFLLVMLHCQSLKAQEWSGKKKSKIRNSWSININGGITSIFSDLSVYDDNFFNKLSKESGPATSFLITKKISNTFGVSGQLLYGTFGSKHNDIKIMTNVLEYNFQFSVDLINLFIPSTPHRFGVIGFLGVGQFLFTVENSFTLEGISKSEIYNTGVPEFTYFVGGGIYYNISPKIGITSDMGLRWCQNDRLENFKYNDDFDYYTYISIGISYFFNSKIPSIKITNKTKSTNTNKVVLNSGKPKRKFPRYLKTKRLYP